MSWIFIDAHERGRMRLAVLPQAGDLREKTVEGRVSPVVALSAFVRPADRIEGVCVVRGPGPFSVIRAGVLVANVMARMKKVPLVGVAAGEADDLLALRDALFAKKYTASRYVAPVYDADPNIGPPAHL